MSKKKEIVRPAMMSYCSGKVLPCLRVRVCKTECVPCVSYRPILALPEANDTFYIHLMSCSK